MRATILTKLGGRIRARLEKTPSGHSSSLEPLEPTLLRSFRPHVKRKYILLLAIAGMTIALDQGSKWWVVSTLKHACEPLDRVGPHRLRLTHCHPENLTVDLGRARARQLAFRRGTRTFYALRCRGKSACLSGPIPLGSAPAGAQVIRLRQDPVQQAVSMFLSAPIETDTLTSGPDGQHYLVETVGADGRRSSLRFRYRSPGPAVPIVDSLFHIRYVENPGAAWGLLADVDDEVRQPLFLVVTGLAVVFILWLHWRIDPSQRLLGAGLALVLGGAVGNLVDRLRHGPVIDFIDLHYYQRFRWPAFNIADVAITVGVIFLLVDGIRTWRRDRGARRESKGVSP